MADWINSAQKRDKWCAVASKEMKFWGFIKYGEFFNFSVKTD